MNNLTTTQEKPVYNPYPNQARWIEEKFGHLKPIIKVAARIVEKEDKPCYTQSQEA